MITDYNIVGTILFSQSLQEIRQQLDHLRKDKFEQNDRIVIEQDISDEYHYVDGVGTKLIAIQKIINQVDISNCFILLVTANVDVAQEIDFVTKFFSIDPTPIGFSVRRGSYLRQIKQYPDTACRKLWDHLYVGTDGSVNPCCLADHRFPLGHLDHDTVHDIFMIKAADIRSQMSQGHRPRACSSCYEKEDNALPSDRIPCDTEHQQLGIKNMDIRLSNICNFKCRMCSEYFSSAIQQETIEIYGKQSVLGFESVSLSTVSKATKNQWLDQIIPLVNDGLDSIYFAGGEPLIMPEHYLILDRCLETGNTGISIRYSTNLSRLRYRQYNVLDHWRRFQTVTVGASVDASGPVAEYIRHGTVWQDIVDNIHEIKKTAPHVNLRITSVVSCLNIENLIALQDTWILQKFFEPNDFTVKVLTAPNFLSPAMLPEHHKDRLGSCIQQHINRLQGTHLAQQWKDVLHCMHTQDYGFALADFKHRTKVLDLNRKQSFLSVFPEFQDLYD